MNSFSVDSSSFAPPSVQGFVTTPFFTFTDFAIHTSNSSTSSLVSNEHFQRMIAFWNLRKLSEPVSLDFEKRDTRSMTSCSSRRFQRSATSTRSAEPFGR